VALFLHQAQDRPFSHEGGHVRSSVDVHNFLQTQGIQHEIFTLSGQARTARRLAALLGLNPRQVAKNLIFVADDQPVLVIIPGDRKADRAKIKKVLDASEVKFADTQTVLDITGYCIGATPPITYKKKITTLIDARALANDIIYTGAGEANMILKLRAEDLRRATAGQVVRDICLPVNTGALTSPRTRARR
jgi:Cys-tRNA(Pro) deacylase